MNSEQYKSQLSQLLPQGKAWANTSDSELGKLLLGIADELARVDVRAVDLQNEADPRTCYELITDWERVCALPDEYMPTAATFEERRQRIVARLIMSGGQSIKYLKELAASLGYDVEIEEYDVFRAGDRVGNRTCGQDWLFAFAVIAQGSTIRWARASSLLCGERLASWNNEALEGLFQQVKPAHTTVIHIYE